MLSIVMNRDVMSWCVLLFCRDALSVRVTGWCHQTPLCVLKSRALNSMKPYIYLKTLYSSFFSGVLCFIRFMLNSKASLLQPCSKNTHWPAWREFSFSVQTWPACDAVTCAGFTVKICWWNCHLSCVCVCVCTSTFKWGFVETAWKNHLVKIVKVYKLLFNRCISFRIHYKKKLL